MFSSSSPLNGCPVPAAPFEGFRVSSTRQGGRVYRDNPPVPAGAKYPFTSIIKSVLLLAYTSMEPFAPAGTIAALAVTVPVTELKFAVSGCGCPEGHAVRYPSGTCGTTARFSEYAWALEGKLQELDCNGNLRLVFPAKDGPPNVPLVFLVSTTRHGVTG
jgi:hypothetical protein